MTPEKEIELCENVAKIIERLEGLSTKMDSFTGILDAHTDSDTVNFQKMSDDLNILKLDKAKAQGIAEEAAKHANSAGRNWGAVSGGLISILVAAISAYFTRR